MMTKAKKAGVELERKASAARINELEQRIWVLKDAAARMVTRDVLNKAIKDSYDIGRESGWSAGVADALIPQCPDHQKALDYIAEMSKPFPVKA